MRLCGLPLVVATPRDRGGDEKSQYLLSSQVGRYAYEGIRDLLIREPALGGGSAELQVFIEERTP